MAMFHGPATGADFVGASGPAAWTILACVILHKLSMIKINMGTFKCQIV